MTVGWRRGTTAILVRLLLVEAAGFATASVLHAGLVVSGFEDPAAATAEGIIAAVLTTAAAVGQWRRSWVRALAIVAQAFALLGSLVGATLLVAVGPLTPVDVALHVAFLVVLPVGLVLAIRAGRGGARSVS